MELTVPAEELIADAHQRKSLKYEQLVSTCRSLGWTVNLLPFEIGCKGFVGTSFIKCCNKLNFSKKDTKMACRLVSRVALRCSYLLYLSRNNRHWQPIDLHIELNDCAAPNIGPDQAAFASHL